VDVYRGEIARLKARVVIASATEYNALRAAAQEAGIDADLAKLEMQKHLEFHSRSGVVHSTQRLPIQSCG
jgi:hypothetical protein